MRKTGDTPRHGARADVNKLVHTGLAADHGKVVDMHVSGQSHVVGDDQIVAENTVMRHVNVGHQQIAATDARNALILNRAGRNRTVFANNVVVADLKIGFFALVLLVLRFATDCGTLEESIVATDRGQTLDNHVTFENGTGADANVRPHHAKRTDLNIIVKFGSNIDNAGMMDFGHDYPFAGPLEPITGSNKKVSPRVWEIARGMFSPAVYYRARENSSRACANNSAHGNYPMCASEMSPKKIRVETDAITQPYGERTSV